MEWQQIATIMEKKLSYAYLWRNIVLQTQNKYLQSFTAWLFFDTTVRTLKNSKGNEADQQKRGQSLVIEPSGINRIFKIAIHNL